MGEMKKENLKETEEATEEPKEDKDVTEDVSGETVEEDLLKIKDKEIAELKDQLLRLQADFMNFRRRANKEKESAMSYGTECLACDILPALDNFQRALTSEEDKENGFYQGVEMIYNELVKKLNDNGIEEIKALGEDFDPNYHNAVFMEESDE